MSRPTTTDDPSTETALVPHEQSRRFVRIRPTDDPIGPESIHAHLRRLHRQLRPNDRRQWYHRFVRTPAPSPLECLLVADGEGGLTYAVGVDDPDAHSGLERVLRGIFPDSYEFEVENVDPLAPLSTAEPVAVEFRSSHRRAADWQTQLASFASFLEDEQARVPLASIVETMAESGAPIAYQVLLRPKRDWSTQLESRRVAIEANQDTVGGQLANVLFGEPERDREHLSMEDRTRLEELEAKDPRCSFDVTARAIVFADEDQPDADRIAEELATALAPIGRTSVSIEGTVSTGDTAKAVVDAVRERDTGPASGRRRVLPGRRSAPRPIVADAAEVGSFFLVGGDALTAAGGRALAPTPGERTTLPRPPVEELDRYRGAGLTLGHPLTQDGTADSDPLVLPPPLQRLHVGWFGKTGSGKSTSLISAILDNHAATNGADVLVDPKGDGMAREYCRAHFARFGTLDDVVYFNCAEVLPAFGFFDIRDELDAGVPRQTAVEDKVDHYVEILTQIMGRDRFEQAVRSPDVIRYLVKAAFDPINGADAFSHRDLHSSVRRVHERQSAPSVSDPDLEAALSGVVANRARTFDEIMAGVANRVEKIPVDQRLARIFNHVPEDGGPHFDLADYLEEDVVIVFDTGDLRPEAQRVLSLVILSNLWSALRRRTRREPEREHSLVNVYVEEAASIAVSDLLKTLLAQSRGFDCSVTLSMQFPAQLRGADPTAYDEVLNNVSTFVTGNVPIDERLARRLATDDMDATAVGNRLRALRRGQWLVALPAGFDDPEPRPFLVGSGDPPPGDPAGSRPLSTAAHAAFEAALATVYDRTRATAGLTLATPSPARSDEDGEEDGAEATLARRVDTALPHTKRLPPTVEYEESIHGLRCRECDNRYDPSVEGLLRAIECCASIEAVDPADVPICDLNLKLSPEERLASEWTDHQLMFVQAVYNAQQGRYDPLEYDIRHDSMLRLQEYVGIDADAVDDLLDADLLRHDTDHPHRLYSVSPAGRDAIGEQYRQGVDYGHGTGDLEESSEHVFGMAIALDYVEGHHVKSADSAVVEAIPYYDIDEGRRLDVAGLDAAGEIVIAVEVERVNNDVLRAVPDDYDKMADCGVEEAIWIVMTRSGGHAVLSALNDPPDGEPRVEKTYSENTPPQQFRIDTPGCTAIYPVTYVRDHLLDESGSGG